MNGLLLPQDVGQAILNYLAQRPYIEVYELVAALQSLEEIEDVEHVEDTVTT